MRQGDPAVQLMEVIAKILRDWPPEPPPPGEWDPAPFRPGGGRYIPKMMTYGTAVIPARTIPLKTDAQLREEAAAKVLAVFRELGVPEPGR